MSTQHPEAGVTVSILPERALEHVRLLELPAELLALVTSENPPILHLRSRENLNGEAKDANAVLCTPDKTYNVRQVSTSNSVYLTRPRGTAGDEGGLPQKAIEAVAKCDSTLELVPAGKQSAVPYIKSTLPTFASTGSYGSAKSISRTELFSNIPLSQAECEAGYQTLACFESSDPQGCFIPSAKVKMQIWETALTTAIAEGADLKDPYLAEDIPVFAMDLKEDWPLELIAAVFAGVSSPTPGGNLVIDEDKCVHFVGLNLLEQRSAGRATDVKDFLKAWKDTVPEAWRQKCEISAIQGWYKLQDNATSISFIDGSSSTAETPSGAKEEAKTALGAKRKWHEKFRASKKTA
ncbi:Hypothetical predicted protein [Lecanosticta acicola]|uniref:Sister chromatid cohesion protein Dcc1 n=1 Tax=Lecanosticta acicola TaxID=111012 RepID=A0AAI8YVT8_9PEZI|nr:Hypothetical predicted protein [Lecanosticta acicola]